MTADIFYHPETGKWFFAGILNLDTDEVIEPKTFAEAQAAGEEVERLFSAPARELVDAGRAGIFMGDEIEGNIVFTDDVDLWAKAEAAYCPSPGALTSGIRESKKHKWDITGVPLVEYDGRLWISRHGAWSCGTIGKEINFELESRNLTEVITVREALDRRLTPQRTLDYGGPPEPGTMFDLKLPSGEIVKRVLGSEQFDLYLPARVNSIRRAQRQAELQEQQSKKRKRTKKAAAPEVAEPIADQTSLF